MERYKIIVDGRDVIEVDDRENMLIDHTNLFYNARKSIEVIGLPREPGEMPAYIGYSRTKVESCGHSYETEGYGYRVRYHFRTYLAKEAATSGKIMWLVDGEAKGAWPSGAQLKNYLNPWVEERPLTIEFVTSPDDYIAWSGISEAYKRYVTRYDGLVTYEYRVISQLAEQELRKAFES